MKVLLAAVACEPNAGSELDVGWRVANLVASLHETWVICAEHSRPAIEEAQRQGLVPASLHFIYLGQSANWHPNRLVARIQSWQIYKQWLRELEHTARDLHQKHQFDLTHHVTYSTVRMASPLWKLDAPHVWGPVGGVGEYPMRFLPKVSPAGLVFEVARTASNRALHVSPSILHCARKSAVVVASNRETEKVLTKWRGSSTGVEVLSAASFPQKKIHQLQSFGSARDFTKPLELFAGGNLIASKGVAFALEALVIAKARGVHFKYRIRGGGPEMVYLKKRADQLKLGDSVELGEALRGEDYFNALGSAHIYLLPSFRENAPLTLLEAMLAGAVPVAVDSSAQGEIISASRAGKAVSISGNARGVVERLADAICFYNDHRDQLMKDSAAAAAHVAHTYSEEHYKAEINRIYNYAISTIKDQS